MAISDQDWELMRQVAAYFESTRKPEEKDRKYKLKREDSRSVNDTAKHFNLNRVKAQKMLITMGVYKTDLTDDIQNLRNQGMSVKEIAEELNVSVSTVSANIPYENEIHGSDNVSDHAAAMREYRAYQKQQAERQVQKKNNNDKDKTDENWKDEWKKEIKLSYTETDTRPHRVTWEDVEGDSDAILERNPQLMELVQQSEEIRKTELKELNELRNKVDLTEDEMTRRNDLLREHGFFQGALADRNPQALEEISGEKLPFRPNEVMHLHLELMDDWSDEQREVVKKHGNLKGEHISRDVIVPDDMPLYAIHYMIQRLFGWQNSHLHQFELSEEEMEKAGVRDATIWKRLVGILFRSPLMDEDFEFWADDYNGGSFKNWMTKKYTGPYLSQCYGEGFASCDYDMQRIDEDAEYYVLFCKRHEEVFVLKCYPVIRYDGTENKEPEKNKWFHDEQWVERRWFRELPLDAMRLCFERDYKALLERLPIWTVLRPLDDEDDPVNVDTLFEEIGWEIDALRESGIDSPVHQIMPFPLGENLHYNYDFGDSWWVKITATYNCEKMVEDGVITQEQLDKANIKCRELYRPVTIAVDGEMLVDDVGGTGGFANFLETINPDLEGMDRYEKAEAKREKKEYLDWAKSLGWKKLSPWI